MDADFTRCRLLLDRSHNKIDSDRDTISHMGDGRQTPDRRQSRTVCGRQSVHVTNNDKLIYVSVQNASKCKLLNAHL